MLCLWRRSSAFPLNGQGDTSLRKVLKADMYVPTRKKQGVVILERGTRAHVCNT